MVSFIRNLAQSKGRNADWVFREMGKEMEIVGRIVDEYVNSAPYDNLVEKIIQWFDLIQPTAILPFQYTDPYPSPTGAWILGIKQPF